MTAQRTLTTGGAIGTPDAPVAWTSGTLNLHVDVDSAHHCHAALRFLRFLTHGKQHAPQAFRLIHDTDRNQDTLLRYGSLAHLVGFLRQANQAGYGVFAVINQTDGKGQAAKNVTRVRAVFVDLDGSPIPDDLHNLAHAAVWTSPPNDNEPARAHLYWLVDDTVTVDLFRPVQQGLINTFAGDAGIHDLPRVMRLPGFLHQKRSPYRVTIHHIDDHAVPLSLQDLRAAFPAVDRSIDAHHEEQKRRQAPRVPQGRPLDADALTRSIQRWFRREANGISTTGRHELLQRAARHLLDNQLTRSAAESLLLNLRDDLPPRADGSIVPDRECRDIVAWTFDNLTPGEPWTVDASGVPRLPSGTPSLGRATSRSLDRPRLPALGRRGLPKLGD